MKNVYYKFDSITQFSAKCSELEPITQGEWNENGNTNFYGTADFDEAKNLLRAGCLDIVKTFDAKLKDLQTRQAQTPRIRPVNSIVGGAANVPAALAGLPLSMIDYKRQAAPGKKKIVNIYYNAAYPSMITTNQIINVGSCVLQLSKNLDGAGYQTNIYICTKSLQPGKFDYLCILKIKAAGERLNLSKVSYCFAHPAYVRRHQFLLKENAGMKMYRTFSKPMTAADIDGDPDAYIINGFECVDNPENIIKEFKFNGARV